MAFENGDRAIVKDICRDVMRDDTCPRGNENKNRIINLEKGSETMGDNIDKLFKKFDDTTEKHSQQWQKVMNGIVGLLIAMISNIIFIIIDKVIK